MKKRTEEFKALKPIYQQTSNNLATPRLDEARKNAKNTAEALLEILALDKARKLDAASDPQITDELRQDRNGFVIRFGEGAKYKIPELANPALVKRWLAFIEAVKWQLELISSGQRSDQLRLAWNVHLDEFLAALDPKAKDLVAVKDGVTKFLRFNGEKLPPDLDLEIKAQSVIPAAETNLWVKEIKEFIISLKWDTDQFDAIKREQFDDGRKPKAENDTRFADKRIEKARNNAKNTAEALLDILALDRARKLYAASDPQITDELRKEKNGFVIRFSDGAKYKIPALASAPLRDWWLEFIEAVNSQLELINSGQGSDQLRNAWNAGLEDCLAALDKTAKDRVAVEGGVNKFLRFKGEKLPPDLDLEIKAQEKAKEKARNP